MKHRHDNKDEENRPNKVNSVNKQNQLLIKTNNVMTEDLFLLYILETPAYVVPPTPY